MTKAIKDKNKRAELRESLNNSLNQIWTSNETVIRNYDANQYGQIDSTRTRIAIHKSPLDTAKVSHAWTTFKSNIDNIDKKSDTSAKDQYHVSQLNDELEKAIKAIDDNQLSDADAALTHYKNRAIC